MFFQLHLLVRFNFCLLVPKYTRNKSTQYSANDTTFQQNLNDLKIYQEKIGFHTI